MNIYKCITLMYFILTIQQGKSKTADSAGLSREQVYQHRTHATTCSLPLPSPNYKLRVGREGHQLLIFTASNFLDESTPVCPSVRLPIHPNASQSTKTESNWSFYPYKGSSHHH